MILNLSTANHLYWLGRYVVRSQMLCHFVELQDDQQAVQIAAALAVPAWNAQTLKQTLKNPEQSSGLPYSLGMVQDNIQSVRGVISQQAFEFFNQIWRNRDQDLAVVCASLQDVQQVMNEQLPLVRAFLSIGQAIETVDMAFRLQQSPLEGIDQLKTAIEPLPEHWSMFVDAVHRLIDSPNPTTFYEVCDQLSVSFTEGV